MMAIIVRLLLTGILLTEYCHGQTVRPEIARLAADIAADHFHVSEHIGFGGSTTDQWRRYDTLRRIATREELIALTDHAGVCTRCYAYEALVDRRDTAIFRIAIRHLYDTDTVTSYLGCTIIDEPAGDYFLSLAMSCREDSCVLGTEERRTLDSIMVHDNRVRLRSKSQRLIGIGPDPAYYATIRDLAELRNDDAGVVALAKYRKQQDIYLIIRKLSSPSIEDQYYGLWAVSHFPDSSFFPYLVAIHAAELRQGACYNWMLLRALYRAVLQYRHDAARTLFESTPALARGNPALNQHVVFIDDALTYYEDSAPSHSLPDPAVDDTSLRRLIFDPMRDCD